MSSRALFSIRRMTLQDVDAVYAIEQASFAQPWSRDSLVSEMTTNKVARYLVATDPQGAVTGYAGVWIVLDEGHITNIAVRQDARRQGIGLALLRALMQYAANLGVQWLTLEVRAGNQAAIALYKKCRFGQVGVRKKYYEDNGEDALLMVCASLPPAEEDFEEAETLRE